MRSSSAVTFSQDSASVPDSDRPDSDRPDSDRPESDLAGPDRPLPDLRSSGLDRPTNHLAWWLFSLTPLVVSALWVALLPAGLMGTGATAAVMSGVAGYVLVQLLLVVTVTDLHDRKIPNWATYPAFVYGLAINVLAYLMPGHADWLGAVGLGQSLAGGFGFLAIMFVIFSLSGGGAGDVKLSAGLGALLGWSVALDAMLYSFIVAGAAMVVFGIWTRGPLVLAQSLLRGAGHWFLPTKVRPPQKHQRELLRKRFPLAPFFACGTILAITLNQTL